MLWIWRKKTECGVGGRPVRALSINERLCVCVTAGDAGPAAAAVDPYLDKALSFSSLCTPKGQTSPCAVSEMETLVNNFQACFFLVSRRREDVREPSGAHLAPLITNICLCH